jgi:DNA-binding NarL/FixJ family response regulator
MKIIIADSQQMFRESIRIVFSIEQFADVIAGASDSNELMELLDKFAPDVILIDKLMPSLDVVDVTKKILEKHPAAKIFALSSFCDEKLCLKMIEAGAKGFMLKTSGISELKSAISEIVKGGNWFSDDLKQKVISNLSNRSGKHSATVLSDRELEIIRLICQSYTNEHIAEKINISFDTVKWHRANILSKTNCTNTAGLVIYAIKNNIIEI